MRVLLVSPHGDGLWFVWLLQHEGHTVDWTCADPKDAETLAGIIPPSKSAPDPKAYDLIVYDSSSMGESADAARKFTPVIGSSVLADQLEHDRVFGLEAMEKAGIKVPPWEPFSDAKDALAWLKKENKRCVLKPIGDAPADATYVSSSAEDMTKYIECRLDKKVKSFVLQEFVSGTEVSTEAWWTGTEWCALNHTLEEKKFMSGGIGPNTGCAGNVVWMPTGTNPLFQQGLEKMGALLKDTDYVGMVDLNAIVTEGAVYGLEWTPRFGYEGTCNLTRLLPLGFGDFLFHVATGRTPNFTGSRHRFAATLRISVPPYPNAETNKRRDQVPIGGISLDNLESFVLYDVQLDGDCLVTGGRYQVIGTPIGCSETIAGAFGECETAIQRLSVPNLQWRNDVAKCVEKRFNQLSVWGWLRAI